MSEKFYLDSDVFIQAANGPYTFEILPQFWEWIDQQSQDGLILSSITVHDELIGGDDELAEWAHARKDSGLFEIPTEDIQQCFSKIADYVTQHYRDVHARKFLDGADPWLVAHAKVANATVITHELLVPINSQKPKIPNVAQAFEVNTMDLYRLLKTLNVSFR